MDEERARSIFPDTKDYKKLQYGNRTNLSYASPHWRTKKALKLLSCALDERDPPRPVIDVCGGLGSASACLGMSKRFSKLTSIELDDERYGYLVNNLGLYLHKDRYETIHTNFIDWYRKTKVPKSVFFVALPWGGEGYRTDDAITETYSISDSAGKKYNAIGLIELIKDNAYYIIVECPVQLGSFIEDNYYREFIMYGLIIKTVKFVILIPKKFT